jgi:hypothetical protein
MRLVPTFASVLSANNNTKFASCLVRQVALAAGLASASTYEMTINLLLDKKDPSTGKSFTDIMMALTPQTNPNTPLFHTIDKQFKSPHGAVPVLTRECLGCPQHHCKADLFFVQ